MSNQKIAAAIREVTKSVMSELRLGERSHQISAFDVLDILERMADKIERLDADGMWYVACSVVSVVVKAEDAECAENMARGVFKSQFALACPDIKVVRPATLEEVSLQSMQMAGGRAW